MSIEVQEYEERNAALQAVQGALTAAEREQFMDSAIRRWPRFEAEGVTPADVLDYTASYDEFLEATEPFFERFASQLPQGVSLRPAVHAVILLGKALTPGRVIALLQRAGMTKVPRYPDVEAGLWAFEPEVYGGVRQPPRDASSGMVMARAEQGMRAQGVPEHAITQFRGAVRHTGDQDYPRNMADVAGWVTLVDRVTPFPQVPYDPSHDLATVLAWAHALPRDPDGQALANLRSHLDLRSAETAEASLRAFFGREGLR